jgi:hypothetical protein
MPFFAACGWKGGRLLHGCTLVATPPAATRTPPVLHPNVTPLLPPPLPQVLGKMPNKTFKLAGPKPQLAPLALPAAGASLGEALHRVLRLPSVCSKRFLTTKVDRHVTGGWGGEGVGRGCCWAHEGCCWAHVDERTPACVGGRCCLWVCGPA